MPPTPTPWTPSAPATPASTEPVRRRVERCCPPICRFPSPSSPGSDRWLGTNAAQAGEQRPRGVIRAAAYTCRSSHISEADVGDVASARSTPRADATSRRSPRLSGVSSEARRAAQIVIDPMVPMRTLFPAAIEAGKRQMAGQERRIRNVRRPQRNGESRWGRRRSRPVVLPRLAWPALSARGLGRCDGPAATGESGRAVATTVGGSAYRMRGVLTESLPWPATKRPPSPFGTTCLHRTVMIGAHGGSRSRGRRPRIGEPAMMNRYGDALGSHRHVRPAQLRRPS